jgi:hypothetical protein
MLQAEREALYREVHRTLEQRLTPTERELFLAAKLSEADTALKEVQSTVVLSIAKWLLSATCEVKVPPALRRAVASAIQDNFGGK